MLVQNLLTHTRSRLEYCIGCERMRMDRRVNLGNDATLHLHCQRYKDMRTVNSHGRWLMSRDTGGGSFDSLVHQTLGKSGVGANVYYVVWK